MTVIGISLQCKSPEDDTTVKDSRDRDLCPEFIGLMGFAFGNAADMRFMKAVNFIFAILVPKHRMLLAFNMVWEEQGLIYFSLLRTSSRIRACPIVSSLRVALTAVFFIWGFSRLMPGAGDQERHGCSLASRISLLWQRSSCRCR
jgi:hypothetical protein